MTIFQYKKTASANRLFKYISVFVIIVLLVSAAKARRSAEGPVELTIYPAKAGELEQYVQGKDSPNLYQALANMPRPVVDVEKAIENEKKVSLDSAPNELMREQITKQMASSFDGTRRISKRLDNNLNGLQCVEAIRHYATTHYGQLPQAIGDTRRW